MALLQVIGREGDVAGGDTELRMTEGSLRGQHVAALPQRVQREGMAERTWTWIKVAVRSGRRCLWASTRSSVTSAT